MGLLEYAIKRTFTSIVLLVFAALVIFFMVRLIPGDPARVIAGTTATDASLEAIRHRLGLDLPVWEQFLRWVQNLFTGDWGRSLVNDNSVLAMTIERYPRSLQLALMSLTISLFIALPLGVISAVNRNSRSDYASLFFSQLGVSIPDFWLGIMLMLVFANYLGLLPASGYVSPTEDLVESIRRSLLPALTLGIINAAVLMRYFRASLIEEMGKDYVTMARALGHPRKRIIYKYISKNALASTLTVVGLQFGYLIGGVVIVEEVFRYPGIGILLLDSILLLDYPVTQIAFLALAGTFLFANLVVDLLYGVLNPKIRY